MEKVKIAVFGGSGRCIAFAARELKSDVEVSVFFDNDKNKARHLVKKGYQYIDKSRVYVPYDNIYIDTPEHYRDYDFEYVVVLAGSRYEIKQQLLDLEIEPAKIIVYDRIISNGIIYVPTLQDCSLKMLLSQAEERGITPSIYKQEAENLLNICQRIFHENYRLHVLKILVTALKAAIEQRTLEYPGGVKLDYQSFEVNPSLFMYESSDIFMDIIEEEVEEIEYIEGPYNFGSVTIEESDVVFDIGANYGLFTAIAASKAKTGKVYAFEPVTKTQKILKRTADMYNNIIIEPYGISDICEKAEINISTYNSNPGGASLMTVNRSSKTEIIDTITLDWFVKKNQIPKIDFIKVDIEGAERLLLAGAKEVLQKFAPKLAICTYHYPEDPALLEFMIKQANPDYVVERAYGKLFAYVNK